MTANQFSLDDLKDLFEAFATSASKFHPSYASVLKNVRSFVVLDTSAEPLFVSEKYFKALAPTVSIEVVPSESDRYQSYLSNLERLATSQRVSFSKREDASWRPHIFYRVVDSSLSQKANALSATKREANLVSERPASTPTSASKGKNLKELEPKSRNGNNSIPASANATSLIVTSAVIISAFVIFLGNLGGARDFVCSIKALKNGCQQIFDLSAE